MRTVDALNEPINLGLGFQSELGELGLSVAHLSARQVRTWDLNLG